jgi:hypothetical protein
MVRAMKLSENSKIALQPPRFVSGDPMIVVGLVERHSFGATQGIPAQWQRFMKHYAEIPDKVKPIPLGISANMDDDGNFEYMAEVQVSKASDLPKALRQWRIPAQHYAVFRHDAHVSTILARPILPSGTNGFRPMAAVPPTARPLNATSKPSTRAPVLAVLRSGSRWKTLARDFRMRSGSARSGRFVQMARLVDPADVNLAVLDIDLVEAARVLFEPPVSRQRQIE